MVNEDTSRTAEAGNDSMDPIMTTANESAPPQKVGIWEHIRQHIDPVSKLASTLSSVLLVAWSVFLSGGGVFFLLYYWSIGFIPDLDLKASVTVLVVAAITGTIILLMLGITLLGPAVTWKLMIQSTPSLQGFWYDKDGKLMSGRAFLWLVWPIYGVFAFVFIGEYFAPSKKVGVAPELRAIIILLMVGAIILAWLRIIYKQELKAIWTFLGQLGWTMFLFSFKCLVVLLTMLQGAFSNTTATEASIDFVIALSLIVLLNGVIATNWLDNTRVFTYR